jgi:hypothetical protein
MAKKFMYVCFGILALAAAFHLGARYGGASYVDQSASGIIALEADKMLLDNGEVWEFHYSPFPQWTDRSEYTPPVPLSDIKFWSATFLVTAANEVWYRHDGSWHNGGSPPGLVATQPTTWGEIKAEFK